jgi:SAM-dependent methyltransferase
MPLATDWDRVLESFPPDGGGILRTYSDAVNRALLRRWLPEQADSLLKTDLFDEAVAEGLYPLLRERATHVVGIDISESVLAAARARYPALRAERADIRALPFADGTFDVVVSISTLDHFGCVEELESAVGELHRVLRDGGTLVVTLDNLLNPLVALRNVLPQSPLRRIGLVPYALGVTCGPRRLRRILATRGFAVAEIDALMHVPRVVVRMLAPLLHARASAALLAAERLGRHPTRMVTGQFVAARAVKRQRRAKSHPPFTLGA